MRKQLKQWLIVLAIALPLFGPQARADDQPLPADQAFRLTVTALDANTLRAQWVIAKGYYLYESKFRFTSATPGITLGKAAFPPAQVKDDPNFGRLDVYHDRVAVEIPLNRGADAGTSMTLNVTYQGCAEVLGVCYPPQHRSIKVTLPAAAPAPAASSADNRPQQLNKALAQFNRNLGGDSGGDGEILPVDQAFRFDATISGNVITANWQIAPGTYLYHDKLHFGLADAPGVRLGDYTLPPGEDKYEPVLQKHERIFRNQLAVKLPLTVSDPATKQVTLLVSYQGCSAASGVCYPPVKKRVVLTLGAATTTAAAVAPAATAAPADHGAASNEARFLNVLAHGNLLTVVLAALAAGLLMAFTACVYPMIPILSSIIVGQGEKTSVARSFGLSLVYVLAVALTFGVVGGITAVAGGGVGIQASFQSPWLLLPFAALFVILALAMFGFYDIQMPSALQSRLNALSNRQRGGTLIGVALMGVFSALIVGPCGGPFLIGALGYAASSAKLADGFLALFSLGLGMGLPLLLVGLGGGALLPRAGGWMTTVKAVAGVILLSVAIIFLERLPALIPPEVTMLLWSALLIVSAVYMGALESIAAGASGWRRLWKGLGIVLLIYGVVVMLGGISGGVSVTDPLHGSRLLGGTVAESGAGASAATQPLPFKRIHSVADLERELAAAKAAHKPVMLDFYADWCGYCKDYEAYVFPNRAVQQSLAGAVLLQADVTAQNDADRKLMEKVGVFLPPAILFFDRDGHEVRSDRVIGYMDPAAFQAQVRRALGL